MMIVVPPFAEREHSDEDVVPAFVTASIRLRAPDMADRVHTPGDVMDDHDSNQTTPDEPEEGTDPEALADQKIGDAADDRGNHEAKADPEGEQTADGSNTAVPDQIGDVAVQRLARRIKDPPDVGVPEAGKKASNPRSMVVQMRRMRITLLIAVLMMAPMCGTPSKDGPLRRHRAQNAQRHGDDRPRTERLVREEPVISDGDAETRDDVHHGHQSKLNPADAVAPEIHDPGDQADDRSEDRDQIRDPAPKGETDVAIDLIACFRRHGRLGRGAQGAQLFFHSVVRCWDIESGRRRSAARIFDLHHIADAIFSASHHDHRRRRRHHRHRGSRRRPRRRHGGDPHGDVLR